MTARKQVRSMRARRASRLACGHVPAIGERIIGRGGYGRRWWICLACAADEAKTSSKEKP
jgi:hypothetical protein